MVHTMGTSFNLTFTFFNFRFVLVNSIALQGDGCSMCSEATNQLNIVAEKLNCYRRSRREVYEDLAKKQNTFCELPMDSPAPILLQVWVPIPDTLSFTHFLQASTSPIIFFFFFLAEMLTVTMLSIDS